jgi:hypothetical protein
MRATTKAEWSLTAGLETWRLGDGRRGERVRRVLRGLAARPSGKVSEVYRNPAERQGAYDFLEHESVSSDAVQSVAAQWTARRCARQEFVYLVLDGSSLSLTDKAEKKGFGSVGPRRDGAQGLKMLNALALGSRGETLGLLAQDFWVRGTTAPEGYRPLDGRESAHWHRALNNARHVLRENSAKTNLHVLADREGDASLLMQEIVAEGNDFTIRANGTRKVLVERRRINVRKALRRMAPVAEYEVEIPRRTGRPARTAALTLRAAQVQLVLRDHHLQQRRVLGLTVVWATEKHPPRGIVPLDWLIYTTTPGRTAADAIDVIQRYGYRWRIEDFHRALKSGGGCVEESQLRSAQAVIKWATLHAMIAARAEGLRDASRATPDAPATTLLSDAEIEALIILKTREKRRTEVVSIKGLTLKQAVRWIADLGGFTATGVSQTPPGATVIARGLERIRDAIHVFDALHAAGKLR